MPAPENLSSGKMSSSSMTPSPTASLIVEEDTGEMDIDGLDLWVDTRWVSVVEFHDQALSIGKVFGQESTVVKWN